MSRLKFPESFKYTNLPALFPHRRETPKFFSELYLNSEEKQNKTLSNISNKTKTKAKNHMCVPLHV